MQKEMYKVSWLRFAKALNELITKIKAEKTAVFVGVIGIPRGGLVIAVCLSHKLGIPLANAAELEVGKNYLLADDVSDSGKQLRQWKDAIEKVVGEGKVMTATLHWKAHTELKPDFAADEVNKWIHYPWESYEQETE